ncbi:hypothetical protein PFISCL1PPCAC_14694 [Pristionchus fissidentatus]|uniref:Uncharacterized protein n=1 Tax=Pristionchus fissidentatus TaxID=1538716 RepID=A0AAV5VZQ1_9BILA|nr:hypothetical protein PFISCL1PPCAC_14694 [Pristionchus fissidentatus]
MESRVLYSLLAVFLFFTTFGFYGLLVAVSSVVCFVFGCLFVIYTKGRLEMISLERRMKSILDTMGFARGDDEILKSIRRFRESNVYDHKLSMTSSAQMDRILEQLLELVMRDFVDPWYKQMTNDATFRLSLLRTMRRSIYALSLCMKEVDWVPIVTRNLTDDVASHLKLFRLALERTEARRDKSTDSIRDDLESHFFDLELEMEKNLCRDLLSTTPHYENAYLHDLVDILLYLLMPPEDFHCRPLRFLLREVLVKRIITPTLDYLSDPTNVNQLLVWLLSEVCPRAEDLVAGVEMSENYDEMEALICSLKEQLIVLRGKDFGGEHGEQVKAEIGSLEFLEGMIKKKQKNVANDMIERGCDASLGVSSSSSSLSTEDLVQLPIIVVLNDNTCISHLMDYLVGVGGQNFIDFYLAIEGFKNSVEHQLRYLSNGETTEGEVRETIREAAGFMYEQYMSEAAITRVPLGDSLVKQFNQRIKKEEPSDEWFDHIQQRIVAILEGEERFYPGFKRDPLYRKMLHEVGIMSESQSRSPETESIASGGRSILQSNESTNGVEEERGSAGIGYTGEETSVLIETLGIGHQHGKQAFALYNVRVYRSIGGTKSCTGSILRRYSHFHLLNQLLQQRYPDLASLSFPGKKTFNNLSTQFIEKRTKALNDYMRCILQPSMLSSHPGMDLILADFLSNKDYNPKDEVVMAKKVVSVFVDPFKSGVRAVTSAVNSVNDTVYEGVTKVGDGINKAAQIIVRPMGGRSNGLETDRVASSLSYSSSTESIPLRVLILLVDEVFGWRSSQAWIRRQLMTILRQVVTPLGSSINKRIISVVEWLSSEDQVTSYLTALRDSVWPDGKLAPPTPPRPSSFHHRTRLLLRVLTLSAIPEELRMILGSETTQKGIKTVCNALQHRHLNRRLLYVIIERLLTHIFPKNRFEKTFAQLHSKSPRSKRS